MRHVLTLVSAAQTVALKSGRFPNDEPALDSALRQAGAIANVFGNTNYVWCAPQPAARQTATALGLDPVVDHLLAEVDYGSWAGRTIKDVIAIDSAGFAGWIHGAAPPQGEALTEVLARARNWLAARQQLQGQSVAVMSSSIVKAVVIAAIGAPAECFARIDISALTTAVLTSDSRRWSLRSSGCPLATGGRG